MVQHGIDPGPKVAQRSSIYKDLVLLQLTALIFLLDQFTKYLVREFLAFQESFPDEGFFRLTHTFNTGSAFGLFQDQNFPLILVSFIGISILVLIYRGQRRPSNLLRLSIGLQLGGATGNLVDRLRLGHVTDFVDVGAWPIFNVADSSIVVGLVMLAWIFIGPDSLTRKRAGTEEALEHIYTPSVDTPIENISPDSTALINEKDDPSDVVSNPRDQQENQIGAPANCEDEGSSAPRGLPPTGE